MKNKKALAIRQPFVNFEPVTSTILSQNIRFDKYIKIWNISVYFSNFKSHGISFIRSMFYINGGYKSWDTTKYGYN